MTRASHSVSNASESELVSPEFSLLVLTYNRNRHLEKLLQELEKFADAGVEVIVVDNHSDCPAAVVTNKRSWIRTVRTSANLGAAGRNVGFRAARGRYVICLDDDIRGLELSALEFLRSTFSDSRVSAVNFRVIEEGTGRLVNWVHHRDPEKSAHVPFDTYEITEGAVAFRRSCLDRVGGYPEAFFLSHEGPDLAFRLMNLGTRVTYCPAITVVHSFAAEGRTSWRNYYFDTRNTLWLAARSLPLGFGLGVVVRQVGAMLLYAIRDRNVLWWAKGLADGLLGLPRAWRERVALSADTMTRVREIDRHRPSMVFMLKQRLTGSSLKL